MLIWFLLRIRPIYDNITVPNLDSSCLEPPLGKAGGFVGLILQEAKSPEIEWYTFLKCLKL